MKKTGKILLSVLVIFVLIASIFAINVSAAGTVISLTKKSLKVGETVTVTIRLNAGEAMYAVSSIINYDASVLEYTSGDATGGAGQLKIVESPSGQTSVSYSLGFKALKSGSSVVSASNVSFSGLNEDKALTGASVSIAVTDATQSANADLKSLSLSDGVLSPAFSPSVTTYNVTVKNSVTSCKIYATTADSAATMTVQGSQKLQIGKNTRSVTVTAPSGAQKTYTINITRNETDDEIIEENPAGSLNVTIENATFVLVADISAIELFKGFEIGQVEYNGQQVQVSKSKNGEFSLYYLKAAEGEKIEPYTYSEELKTFEKINYYKQGEITYIFSDIPSDLSLPNNYYPTNVRIGGMDIKGYSDNNSNLTDFYYLYCFSGEEFEFYRYDSRDNILQRYPELTANNIKEVEPPAKETGFLARYKSLSGNSKLIVLAAGLLVLSILALSVILIIQLIRRNKVKTPENNIDDEDFDVITIE
ncbi:MAG: cadherin-like beta sandwich domain-containing protein [Clostridia bacterium]|nr:cadherin-like beta sandwich domain-containing protein [Clostridia bacterium]